MDFMDFIYVCTNPDCRANGMAEAPPEPIDDDISVRCGLCGKKRNYPKTCLKNATPLSLEEHLRGYFEVQHRRI